MKRILTMLRLPAAALFLTAAVSASAAVNESVTVNPPTGEGICLFSSLDLTKITCFDDAGKTKVRADRTTLNNPIVLKDTLYTSGVGTHAPSKAVIDVKGATRFTARLGVDDEASSAANHGVVDYVISTYKNKVATTVMQGTINRTDDRTVAIDIDLTGCDYLVLNLESGAQKWADEVSWANAAFEYSGEEPVTILENEMYSDGSKVVDLPTVGTDGAEIIPLSSLEIGKAINGWGTIRADKSIGDNPITLKDTVYTSGVGAHATNQIIVKLNGSVTRFCTRVGIDDEVAGGVGNRPNAGVCDYRVSLKAENGDTRVMAEGTIRYTDTTTPLIDIDCNGWKYLILEADEGAGGNDNDHVDWANAYFEYIEQNSTPP
ncbi:MAG: NPCBM/NEW2 domain-containing protein, partial [Bacteroidaceae bacterium]|nr:NPCBM/NEW2 domain-containing protein [Bacteroidaceae bacterium]